MTDRTLRAALALLVLLPPAAGARAGAIYRCTQADGSITLSDTDCPPDTLTREYRGETGGAGPAAAPANDPWSVMNQARRLQEREAARSKAGAGSARGGHAAKEAQGSRTGEAAGAPALSYPEARRRALEATGYGDDAHLSRTQRERVAAEMARYGQTLREPAKRPAGHGRKGEATRGGAAAGASPDGSGRTDGAAPTATRPGTPDPRNATLGHNPR